MNTRRLLYKFLKSAHFDGLRGSFILRGHLYLLPPSYKAEHSDNGTNLQLSCCGFEMTRKKARIARFEQFILQKIKLAETLVRSRLQRSDPRY